LEVAAAEAWTPTRSGTVFTSSKPGNKRAKIGWLASERQADRLGYVTRTPAITCVWPSRRRTGGAHRNKVLTDLQHKLQYLDFSMSSDLVKFKVIGTVRGNRLDLDIETAAGRREETLPLTEVPLMPDDLTDLLADEGGLEVGKTYEMPFFEPSTFRYDKAKIRVVRPDRAHRRRRHEDRGVPRGHRLAGARAESIVDERAKTLEQRLAGFVMVLNRMDGHGAGVVEKTGDIPEMAAVNSDRQIPIRARPSGSRCA
jgi:hypothetical protein